MSTSNMTKLVVISDGQPSVLEIALGVELDTQPIFYEKL